MKEMMIPPVTERYDVHDYKQNRRRAVVQSIAERQREVIGAVLTDCTYLKSGMTPGDICLPQQPQTTRAMRTMPIA